MSRRNITDEFKAEAVQLVVAQGYSFAKASEALGVGDTALRRWVAQWRAEQVQPPRTQVQVKAERDILKKSTAFFVKELDRSSK
jgi:transposase